MLSNKGPCMKCRKDNPVFLHYISVPQQHSFTILHVMCTATFPGAYCPICFRVFESEHFDSTPNPYRCSTCQAVAHFSCVYDLSATTSKSAAASSIPPARYNCPPCSDPNFRFFNCERDEQTQTARIDKHLCQELLAASIISNRCMKEAEKLCQTRVEILAQEAADARKRATQALEKLAQLTLAPQEGQNEDDDDVIISSNEDSDEEIDSEESYTDGEESNNEWNNSEEIDEEENDREVNSDQDNNDEQSD